MLSDYVMGANYLFMLFRHTHWSKEELLTYRNRRVREIVSYAYTHVPFYHEKFRQLGLKPEELKTAEDLSKLPVIRRAELQRNADSLISSGFNITKLKKISTSGSTGQPLFTHITMSEDAFRKAKLLRANIICGQRLRDKWVIITGPQHEADTHRLQKFLRIYLPTPLSVFDSAETQISKINEMKPDILDGYSSSLLLLAKEVEETDLETAKPRMIIGGAELIDNSSRRFVERVFEAPFYDAYACVELEKLAWQCKEKSGYHIDADSVIMQFVDEEGKEVGPGETGEIVCTSLFNYAMPFIRYAVGDVGRLSKDPQCSCGIPFPLMEVIEGRKDSLIVLPDGQVISPLTFGWIMEFFKYYACIDQYRVVQKKINLFRFIIRMSNSARTSVDEKVMADELSEHFRQFLNMGSSKVDFEVEFVDEIPLDRGGKLRKVISELRGHGAQV
jgi:phenylacetate-CoA ligase